MRANPGTFRYRCRVHGDVLIATTLFTNPLLGCPLPGWDGKKCDGVPWNTPEDGIFPQERNLPPHSSLKGLS